MLKYVNTSVVFAEIPNEITLAINISQCPNKCKNCHSEYLQSDIGNLLTSEVLFELIKKNKGISCVCLMGGDAEPSEVSRLLELVKDNFLNIKTAWYSGKDHISKQINIKNFDFIKIGPYIEKYGPLNNKNTNQIMYEIRYVNDEFGNLVPFLNNITSKFWK